MHFEFDPHCSGNSSPELDINPSGLAINFIGIGGEVFVDAHFQVAGLKDNVVGSLRRPVQELVAVVNLLGQGNLCEKQHSKNSRQ